jgi:DNA-binding transcriptional ArsR family regulator
MGDAEISMQRYLCKGLYAKVSLHMVEGKARYEPPAQVGGRNAVDAWTAAEAGEPWAAADEGDAGDAVVAGFPTPPPLGSEAIKAFAHPLRTAMYQYLSAHGPATASRLARQFGESTGQTSYHLRQLEKHGLIEDDPDRARSGRERWWRPISFSLDPRTVSDPAARVAASTLLRAVAADRAATLQSWFDLADRTSEWVDAALHMQSTPELTVAELNDLAAAISRAVDSVVGPAKQRAEDERRQDAVESSGNVPPGRPPRRRVRIYADAFPLESEAEAAAQPGRPAP